MLCIDSGSNPKPDIYANDVPYLLHSLTMNDFIDLDKEEGWDFEWVLVELLNQKGLKSTSIKVHGEIDVAFDAFRKMDLRNTWEDVIIICCIAE